MYVLVLLTTSRPDYVAVITIVDQTNAGFDDSDQYFKHNITNNKLI